MMPAPSFVPLIAAWLIRATEKLGIPGGPSLLRLLQKTGIGAETISTVTLPSGERICFPSLDPYWAPYLWGRRVFEPDVEAIFHHLSRVPDKILVDCGANIGFWTVRMSNRRFGFARFIAVEPNPRLIPLLERNVALNGIDCTIAAEAIAEVAGLTVYLSGTEQHAAATLSDQGLPVRSTTLDVLLSPTYVDGSPIVVKLDVEGSEIAAMRGAGELAGADILFIYEDWPGSGFAVTQYLLTNGYSIFGIWPERSAEHIGSPGDAMQFNHATHPRYGPSNLLAGSPRAFARLAPLLEPQEAGVQ
jgi:FkbM family methyltransferase